MVPLPSISGRKRALSNMTSTMDGLARWNNGLDWDSFGSRPDCHGGSGGGAHRLAYVFLDGIPLMSSNSSSNNKNNNNNNDQDHDDDNNNNSSSNNSSNKRDHDNSSNHNATPEPINHQGKLLRSNSRVLIEDDYDDEHMPLSLPSPSPFSSLEALSRDIVGIPDRIIVVACYASNYDDDDDNDDDVDDNVSELGMDDYEGSAPELDHADQSKNKSHPIPSSTFDPIVSTTSFWCDHDAASLQPRQTVLRGEISRSDEEDVDGIEDVSILLRNESLEAFEQYYYTSEVDAFA